MIKVAILDDYQNVSQEFIDLKKLSEKYEIKVFNEPFIDESDAIEQLKNFEALLIMRERTKITENLVSSLKKLKYIITSIYNCILFCFFVSEDFLFSFVSEGFLIPYQGKTC